MIKQTSKRYASVKDIPDLYPVFSEPGVRWLIYNAPTNGFNICLRKLGKKLLIDLDEFESWIDNHRELTRRKKIKN